MKKWFIRIIIACSLLLIISVYFFIPEKLTFSESVLARANPAGAYRCLIDKNQWSKVLGLAVTKNTFDYNGQRYVINEKTIDGILVNIKNKDSFDSSVIRILPLSNDSSAIVWEGSIATGLNPFKKIAIYFDEEKKLKSINDILGNIKQYLNLEENVYGIVIRKELIKDSILMYLKRTYTSYPDDKNIYETINTINKYLVSKGAQQRSYPMLNITKTNNAAYETKVALPIDKYIDGEGNIELKNLILGNILVTEVKGGQATILNAANAIERYITDHQLSSPGVPYQSLITNRLTEKDTSNWVTKICYPVY